ncbi:MAG: DUF1592 domain-containing protein [Aureliella sp.]
MIGDLSITVNVLKIDSARLIKACFASCPPEFILPNLLNYMRMLLRQTYKLIPTIALTLAFLPAESWSADGDSKSSSEPAVAADAAEHAEFWNNELQPFLEQYCYDCHSGDGSEADVDFEVYSAESNLAEQRPRWNQVRGMIEIGAMPPADYDPQPSREQREKIADWIDRRVNKVECGVTNDAGRVTIRRLNNVEYDNTLRDLLSIDFKPSELIGFPSDGVGNGFDNQGDVLTLAPLQMEKYLQAAEYVASRVIVQDVDVLREQEALGEKIFIGETATRKFLFANGEYSIRIRLEYGGRKNEKVPVAVLFDGKEIKRIEATGRELSREVRFDAPEGEHTIGVKFIEDKNTEAKRDYDRRVEITYIRVTGPKGGEPKLPESHLRLMVAEPDDTTTVESAAEQVFRPFIRRAFRRDPTETDVTRVVGLVKMATDEGLSFEEAVSYGLQSVLVSPHFLFRSEKPLPEGPRAEDTDSEVETLSDYALATRLSYFIWASCPDDELLDLAGQGKLRDPDVIEAQVERMLLDDRASMLVERFFGQAFGLGNLTNADPSPKMFPVWNDRLRAAMLEETYRFCREILNQDMPLTALITGDFTFVNPRLAEHYGVQFEEHDPRQLYIDGPGFPVRRNGKARDGDYKYEDKWVRVDLPKGRRGILTQGSVLTLTSNPTSTSPVKRGQWILENVFGDPPPPAPPNVPNFEATQSEHENLSLREQLAIHRENPSCASCHNVMDPLGLGFEHFDAIGRWREKDGEHPIDAAGQLADGRKFDGSTELVSLIETSSAEVSRHFADKLLTYAIGRGLEPYDFCAVDDIVERAEAEDYRVSAFVKAVATSQPFRRRRTETKE